MYRLSVEGEKQPTASGWVISTEEPWRVLLVHHKKFDKWVQPGGHCEQDENPWQAACREVMEEVGLEINGADEAYQTIENSDAFLIPQPWIIMEQQIPAWEQTPAHIHVDHQYIFRVDPFEPVVDPKEAHQVQWFTPEEVMELNTFENVRWVIDQLQEELA